MSKLWQLPSKWWPWFYYPSLPQPVFYEATKIILLKPKSGHVTLLLKAHWWLPITFRDVVWAVPHCLSYLVFYFLLCSTHANLLALQPSYLLFFLPRMPFSRYLCGLFLHYLQNHLLEDFPSKISTLFSLFLFLI